MIFLRPDYLLFMMIPMIILFYFIVTGKSQIQSVFDKEVLEKLTVNNNTLGRIGRNIMLFAALFLMIIALARPVLPKGEITAATKSIDLLIALDISKSMLATDRYPNRLAFAKKKIFSLLDQFEEANMGLIAFADDGFIVSPMSEDINTLKYLIDNLTLTSISTNGTNLLVPIIKAKEFLKDKTQKILILFTDGGNKKNFTKEIQIAKEAGITIYIYAIGTQNGAPIPYHGENIKDGKGNLVISSLNDIVKSLAIETGGAYIQGGYKDQSMALIVKDIKQKFTAQEIKNKKFKDYKELFYYPLTLSVLFILFAFSSLPKRITITLSIAFACFIPTTSLKAGILDFQEIKQTKQAYAHEKYANAITHFESIANRKKSPHSYYNLGNAYYKYRKYEKAIKAYEQIKTVDPKLNYKKFFNLGNCYFQKQNYIRALKRYNKAKEIKIEEDLTYNIEFTKKYLKKKPPKKSKPKQPTPNKENKNKDQKPNQNDQKQQPTPTNNKQQSKSSKSPNTKQPQISPQEMKKWEKKLQKSKPKTMPIRFQLKNIQREKNAKPW